MKVNLKSKSGITLVALIITIIVLLILAMVSIRLVMNGGIIDKSKNAVDRYSDAEIQEQLKLAYQEYQMAKYTEEGYTLQNALAKTGLDIASVEGNDSTGYEVKVNTKDGEKAYIIQANGTVVVASTEWTYDGHGTYTKGIKQYKVGDKVNYNEGTGYSFTTDTTKGMGASATQNNDTGKYDLTGGTYTTEDLSWRILGVNSQGQVELISETPHSVQVALANEEGYYNGPDELNKLCDFLYGKGTGAESARSLKVTDLNKLANYDPATDTANNSRYNTYRKYRFTSEGAYEYSDSVDGKTNWSNWTSIPSYYGVNSFTMIGSNTTLSASNPGETEAIRNTSYYCNTKTAITSTVSESFANMLIDSDNSQWLASSFINVSSPSLIWGMFGFDSTGLIFSYYYLYYSSGSRSSNTSSVRPVVTLSSDVLLKWNETGNQWEIQ